MRQPPVWWQLSGMVTAATRDLPNTRERRLWVAEVERVRGGLAGLTPAQIEALVKVLVTIAGPGAGESPRTSREAAELLDEVRRAIDTRQVA
jgi:hypothetical protein